MTKIETPVSTLISLLARLYPWEVDASDELTEALSYLEAPHEPETVVRAGFGAGFLAPLLSLPLFFLSVPIVGVSSVALFLAVATIHTIQTAPLLLASLRRSEALGQAPNLIGRIVLRMKIQPSLESSVKFAAETGNDPLSKSLQDHINRAMGTPGSGLLTFSDEWVEYFPSVRRSAHLLNTAQDAPGDKREQTLERALAAILNGTRDQMAEFTNAIRSPTTGLYAFGVMLPLALISLVPAISTTGVTITIEAFVIVYNFILPGVIIVVGGQLLVKRPVAFPPPQVTRDHPDIDTHWLVPAGAAVVAGGGAAGFTIVLGIIAPSVQIAHLAPISGIGLLIGVFLYLFYKPVVEVRDYVRDVETHLVDALYIIGRQVDESEAVESAIETAGERLPAATGDVFEQAAGRQHRLHLTVDQSFLGKYGVLEHIPSPRAHATARLLGIAAKEGQPAGMTIVSMADHLEELQEVERHTKREISSVTGTLKNTASVFGPLVAGATVALASTMVGQDITFSDLTADVAPLATELLGIVIGVYIIFLSLLLQPLAIGLKSGLDRPLIGYRVGRSLIMGVPIYISSVFFVGLILSL